MTLDELIEELTMMRDQEDVPGNTEVHGAYQPNYPLYADVETVTFIRATGELYIGVCDNNSGYAPSSAFDGGVVEDDEDEED